MNFLTKQRNLGNKTNAFLAFVLLPLALAGILYLSLSSGNEPKPQVESSIPDKYEMYAQGQRYVLQALKSPSTAEFPPIAFEVIDLGDMRYKVVSYVDSQNSFGATVRSNWSVMMAIVGDKWILETMIIDGRNIYDAPYSE